MARLNPASDLAAALEAHHAALSGALPLGRDAVVGICVPLGRLVMEGDFQATLPTLEHIAGLIESQRGAWGALLGELVEARAKDYCLQVERLADLEPESKFEPLAVVEALREELEALVHAAAAFEIALEGPLEREIEVADEILDGHLDA